jgi:5'-3' exonuclease
MQGDSGDNIFGIPWIGPGTSIKEIAKYGSCVAVMAQYHKSYDYLREKYPDVKDKEFDILKSAETTDGKRKFPHIKKWMPFTGVALEYEKGKVKIPRSVIMALVYESRIAIAKSLKAMHREIPVPQLPACIDKGGNDRFVEFCKKYSLAEIATLTDNICAIQRYS